MHQPWVSSPNLMRDAPFDLQEIFEEDSVKELYEEVPALKVAKRLSCFESICPSELDGDVEEASEHAEDEEEEDVLALINKAAFAPRLNRQATHDFSSREESKK